MRPRSLEAVAGRVCQSGLSTLSTSSVSMSETFLDRMGAAYRSRVIRHCARCLWFRHPTSIESKSWSAHSPKVGSDAFRPSAMGSRPAATASLHSEALCRALRSGTAGYAPSPFSRRLPSCFQTNTQERVPDGFTFR